MRIGILGPPEVHDEHGRPLAIAGSRLQALVARLALDAGRSAIRARSRRPPVATGSRQPVRSSLT